MKYSVAAASTLATVALAVKPEFLNNSFDVAEGEPFTLEFTGCETGCTITLQTGSEDDLQDVEVLSTSASGGSLSVTLDDVPTGSYNFKITNNDTGEENYSLVFDYDGSAPETTSSAAPTTTSMPETTTTAASTTTEASTTSSSSSSTSSMTTTTMSSASSSASESSSSTATDDSTSTTGSDSSPTTPPDSAAGRLGSTVSLAVCAVAAMVLFA